MKSLKHETINSAVWIGIERFGQQGIQFVVSIILARLLLPAEFGLIAMITIFTGLATRLAFGGLNAALIQRPKVTDEDISTVLWFNMGMGLAGTLIIWLCAPLISDFYAEPRLTAITRWSSMTILFSSLEMTHGAMLMKELQYRKRALAMILGILVSGTLSILMAYNGYGVWSLVAQSIAMHAVITIIYWITSSWRVRFVFNVKAFREMFSFGHNLMLAVLARTIFENIYAVIIGKLYTATDLGFFQRGKRFTMLFSQVPSMMLSQLNVPMLARSQHDKKEMLRIFSRLFRTGMIIIIPLLTGMAVVAPNMIVVLVGEKWLPTVPYLRILCATGVFYTMFLLCGDVLRGCGAGRAFLKCEIIKHVLTAISIIAAFRFGIEALLIGETIATAVGFVVICKSAMRCLDSSINSLLGWLIKPVLASCVMGIFAGLLLPNHLSVFSLCMKIVLGAVAYALALVVMKDEIVGMVMNLRKPLGTPRM